MLVINRDCQNILLNKPHCFLETRTVDTNSETVETVEHPERVILHVDYVRSRLSLERICYVYYLRIYRNCVLSFCVVRKAHGS